MATRDTIQELEDIIPTKGDHGLDSSSTCHRLVGKYRLGKITARRGRRRISVRQHNITKRLMTTMNPEFTRKVKEAEQFQERKNLPNADRKTELLHHLRVLQDQRCSGESHKHERLAQH